MQNVQELHLPYESPSLEILPVLIDFCDETVLLILIYRPPVAIGNFFVHLFEAMSYLPSGKRTIILGDFNLDQRSQSNIDSFNRLLTNGFTQRSNFSTFIHGGILDLIFDNSKTNSAAWLPSPYSDHFTLFFDV